MKRTIELISVVAIAMALTLTIAFSGVASASPSVPPTKETEILKITTDITCSGTVVESQELSLEIDSKNLLAPLVPLAAGEVYGKIKYDEIMIGSNGTTEFTKCFNVNTNVTPNLDVHKQIGYTASFLGLLSHDEQVGMTILAAGKKKIEEPDCPFDKPKITYLLGSCEEVNAYSRLMVVTDVSATTMTEVGITDTGAPVNLNYDITATGDGLVVAGVYVDVQDGRRTDKDIGSRWTYMERSRASGEFEFTKKIGYKSKPP